MEPVSNLGKLGRFLILLAGIVLLFFGGMTVVYNKPPENMGQCRAVISGFVLVTKIDYRKLKVDDVKVTQLKDLATTVDYEEGALKNTILEDMATKKFTCK